MQLAVGPILYYWSRSRILDFYEQMAQSSVDIVYLGEVVCSRRHELRPGDWRSLANDLKDAGKEVVLSLPPMLESHSDLIAVKKLIGDGEFQVELNEIGALNLIPKGAPFVAGPHLNIYNPMTLSWFSKRGAVRWVAPIEMDRTSIGTVVSSVPLPTEVFAFGRLPLAFSARCFTARHHNLQKDQCEFRCSEDPDGLLLKSREGQAFLALNGIQTQSALTMSLLDRVPEMDEAGVKVVRLSPQSERMSDIVDAFARALRREPFPEVNEHLPVGPCNGYWLGEPGLFQSKLRAS